VEQSGNINPFPPFNYPAKASLMRYSKGRQGVTWPVCWQSITATGGWLQRRWVSVSAPCIAS
jgi:hypothetical protein